MNHLETWKQAWQIVRRYRALWVFGAVFALVTLSWTTGAILERDEDWEERGIQITVLDDETFWDAFRRTTRQEMEETKREIQQANRGIHTLLSEELGLDVRVNVLWIGAAVATAAALGYLLAKVARYVSETAMIRMVGSYRVTGERLNVWQGLRLGWSRSTWRLFLIDLIISVVAMPAGILAFFAILIPLPLWVNGSEGVIFTFALLTGGLFFVTLVLIIIAAAAVAVVKRLARQACALEELGVFEAIARGWQTFWGHLKHAGLTWLITLVLRLGWSLLIGPVVLMLIGLGLIFGGLPAVAAGGLTGLIATADTPIFVALAVGIPLFLLVLIAPVVLLGGMREVLISALWTLTYQELHGLEIRKPAPRPVSDTPGFRIAQVV